VLVLYCASIDIMIMWSTQGEGRVGVTLIELLADMGLGSLFGRPSQVLVQLSTSPSTVVPLAHSGSFLERTGARARVFDSAGVNAMIS